MRKKFALFSIMLISLFAGLPANAQLSNVKNVFIILMENHNWSQIKGSTDAPYINNTLLPMASHAEQFFNPPGIHPSLPNYLWLEAGTNFGITNDSDPSSNHQSTTAHLVTQLTTAGISWKTYQENISGTSCPLTSIYPYAPKHNPFVYFDDVTNTNNVNSAICIAHVRPHTEFAADIANNALARYIFITPNLCNDMHDSCGPSFNPVRQGDDWLRNEIPMILNSPSYQNGGAIFITWDEGEGGDGPIGMIVLSPFAKGGGYSNSIYYNHGSTLRTVEEIFGVPLLRDAANQVDLSDLFLPAPPPPAPTGLAVTPGMNQVSLSWSAVSGASSYNALRSTVSGRPYGQIASNITTLNYVDSAVMGGTTYYYVVQAVSAAGTSANSAQASATPSCSAPLVPTGLSATAGNMQVALSWAATTGAASYNLKRSTNQAGPYSTIHTGTSTSFTDTGVSNGFTYYYVVSEVNGCGTESGNSSGVNAVPVAPVPPAPPTNLKASSPGSSGKVTLKWTQSTSTGITGNKVYRWNGSLFALLATLTSPTTSYTDANVQRSTTYTYYVTAVSAAGESQPSNQSSATTK